MESLVGRRVRIKDNLLAMSNDPETIALRGKVGTVTADPGVNNSNWYGVDVPDFDCLPLIRNEFDLLDE